MFLNLVLSMIAALQAPVIMMSQNRQTERDRLDASHDYEVNLKAEIEILALHEKLDALRQTELVALREGLRQPHKRWRQFRQPKSRAVPEKARSDFPVRKPPNKGLTPPICGAGNRRL